MSNNDVIQAEIQSILDDVKALYDSSGKRTSGNFETQLEARYGDNKAEIFGLTYLAGRGAGKMPPVKALEEWIKAKGIKPIEDKMTVTSLAWAIAKSIANKGTNKASQLKIYEQIITPERIDEVINKVSQFNANLFVEELTTELELLEKNI